MRRSRFFHHIPSDPNDDLDPVTTIEIQCTSTAGSQYISQSFTFNGGASQADVEAAEDSVGADVDRAERSDFQSLLAASIKRVQADLLTASCAKDFKNAANASTKAGQTTFHDYGFLRVTTQPDGSYETKVLAPAINPLTRTINLNSDINWADPGDKQFGPG